MKRTALMVTLTFTVGIVVGVVGNHVLNAQQAPIKATDLFKMDLAGTAEGNEAFLQLVEIAPRGSSGKHYHPGQEITYFLAGSVILEREGQPPQTLKAGDSGTVGAAKLVHEAKNPSATTPVKLLVFRINPKGQPLTVRVTEPYFMK